MQIHCFALTTFAQTGAPLSYYIPFPAADTFIKSTTVTPTMNLLTSQAALRISLTDSPDESVHRKNEYLISILAINEVYT
jgi:hypothetical protein